MTRQGLLSVSSLSLVLIALLGVTPGAFAGASSAPNTDAMDWVNGGPVSLHAPGKVIAFLLYEEGCPGCRKKWPGYMSVAKSFEDQPVQFVAVNSGNSKASVERYAQAVKLTWPVLVDQDRSFENFLISSRALRNPISLRNITQVALLMPDGTLTFGRWNDLGGSVRNALASGAKWQIDPSEVPSGSEAVWRAYEFGQYAPIASKVKSMAGSRDEKTKALGEKMLATMNAQADKLLAEAKSQEEAKNSYAAFKQYNMIATTFRGFDQAKEASKSASKLKRDAQVRKELTAASAWAKIMKLYGSNVASDRKNAVAAAKTLAKRYPDTEAGKAAADLRE